MNKDELAAQEARRGRRVYQNPYEKYGMEKLSLPPRPFLYTLDQISMLLNVSEITIRNEYVYYDQRSMGIPPKRKFFARNIQSDPESKPDWRVTEVELKRWFKYMGFRWHEGRGGPTY